MAPKRRRSDKFKIDEFCVDDDSEKSSEFNVPQKVMSSTAALRIPNNAPKVSQSTRQGLSRGTKSIPKSTYVIPEENDDEFNSSEPEQTTQLHSAPRSGPTDRSQTQNYTNTAAESPLDPPSDTRAPVTQSMSSRRKSSMSRVTEPSFDVEDWQDIGEELDMSEETPSEFVASSQEDSEIFDDVNDANTDDSDDGTYGLKSRRASKKTLRKDNQAGKVKKPSAASQRVTRSNASSNDKATLKVSANTGKRRSAPGEQETPTSKRQRISMLTGYKPSAIAKKRKQQQQEQQNEVQKALKESVHKESVEQANLFGKEETFLSEAPADQ